MPETAQVVWARLIMTTADGSGDGDGTLGQLWAEIRRLAPETIIDLCPVAYERARRRFTDSSLTLIERRRAVVVAMIVSHRLVFDLMALERSPNADLGAPASPQFFADGNSG